MKRFSLFLLISILISAFIFNACEINEAEPPKTGTLIIKATDLNTNEEITDAEVRIDGIAYSQSLPDTVDIAVGTHTIEIIPSQQSFPAKSRSVNIVFNQRETITFEYDVITYGSVTINANIADAKIIINDKFVDNEIGSTIELAAGASYDISVSKKGYQTLSPTLVSDHLVSTGENTPFTFELEELEEGIDTGKLAPDFSLADLDGNIHTPDQYRGRVLLIDFWFVGCTACLHEFPDLNSVYTARYGDGFRMIAIDTGITNDSEADMSGIRDELSIRFPMALNTLGMDLLDTYQAMATPKNVIVDKHGVVRYVLGATNEEELTGILDELLAEE